MNRPSLRGVWKALRSRRLAVGLLLATAVYGAVATSIPGLGEKGFSSPIFLVIAGLLGLSTAACAWERTALALRRLNEPEGVDARTRERLERREPIAIVADEPQSVMLQVRAVLASMRLRTRATATVVRGRSSRLGLLGSPLFHWSLAALFIVVALGRLGRSEGLIGVPVGAQGVSAAASSFRVLERGPLYREGRIDRIVVSAMRDYTLPGGIKVVAVPTVSLVSGDRVLAKSRVYPNHPLRYGSVLVHDSAWGYFGRFELAGEGLGKPIETVLLFDLGGPSGILPADAVLTNAAGEQVTVRVTPVRSNSATTSPVRKRSVSLAWRLPSGEDTKTVLSVGGVVPIGAERLRFVEAGRYARLSVVDDWSVYPIYALLTLATLGLAVAILAPRKTAWVLVTPEGDGTAVRLLAAHDRRDSAFEILLTDALRELGTEETENE